VVTVLVGGVTGVGQALDGQVSSNERVVMTCPENPVTPRWLPLLGTITNM